ncbi:MAG: hypothetical protein KBB01_05130 [Candidatus Omnitrophica bacterium]|jgi:predicted  nucleic acid-binding Zn-ribbon protein|nr:hypothetical protein [Candidatus Omnitrophota bacterium]
MNLKEEIKKIVDLQEIDSNIHSLTELKEKNLPLKLKKITEEFEQKKQKVSIFEEKTKALQLTKKDKELNLASKEDNLKKSQGQLYQLKTNKEYQAKLTEIASLKADISLAEESLIKVLDELEDIKKEFTTEKEHLSKEEAVYLKEKQIIADQQKDIEAKINNLYDKRKIYTKDIDKKVLLRYESLLKTRRGLAIVPIKNNNCSACFIAVTHQKINDIKKYLDLVSCENCVRILYIPEDIS